MPLVINTNIASLNAQRLLSSNTNSLHRSMEKLSSGYRINRAADDAAGLQISETLRSQIRGMSQAMNNAQDGVNLLAVAEGTLSVVQENMQRIRELVVQAANDTYSSTQRDAVKQEIETRIEDINRITRSAQYNGLSLLQGDPATYTLLLQVGANASLELDTVNIGAALGSATATQLAGTTFTINVASNSGARAFLVKVDAALASVGERRAFVGSQQNRLESAVNNLQIARENYESSESRIRNVDVAKESSEMIRNQILQQASASILAQANQSPMLALKLLNGGG